MERILEGLAEGCGGAVEVKTAGFGYVEVLECDALARSVEGAEGVKGDEKGARWARTKGHGQEEAAVTDAFGVWGGKQVILEGSMLQGFLAGSSKAYCIHPKIPSHR